MSEETTTVELAANEKAVVDAIEKLTVIEANNVAKYFEDTYGISAAAAAPAAAAGGAEEVETKTDFDVVLKDCGGSKIKVIKLVREITGLGLGEAKKLAEDGGVVKEKAKKDEAEELKAKFEEVGATIELA